MALDVTDQTFYTEVLQRSHEVPVVVDFWADWCGPCKALAPVLEREAAEREASVVLAKVDVDANQALAQHYEIRGIPAVKAFRNGKVVREFTGVQSPQSVTAFFDALGGPSTAERLLGELRDSGADDEVVDAVEQRDFERALELLLERVRSAPDAAARDRVRTWMVSLFEELGHDDEVATRYRKRLAAALY